MYKVLIVEDDPMVLLINQRYLEKLKHFNLAGTAQDYETALRLTSKFTFDLVLIDIHLKNGNGIQLMKTLKKREYPAEIIMITAANEKEAIKTCLQHGVFDYILKPFQFERFKKSLLNFESRQILLQSNNQITQQTLDNLQNKQVNTSITPEKLAKGLNSETLEKIKNAISQQTDGFTVNEITQVTGLSHVSVRKYLHYLAEDNYIHTHLEYGTVGRPTSLYYYNPNKETQP